MNLLITGANGLVGTALVRHFSAVGHRAIPLSREGTRAAGPAEATWDIDAGHIDLTKAGRIDAVIHLAGETVAQRWTPAAKTRIRDSRVKGTRLLSEALSRLNPPPPVLLCASATGFYGDRGNEWLNEGSDRGHGFLADVCGEWEAASAPAEEVGIRVSRLRFGIVLAREGGALRRMLPMFRLGLAGRLGRGGQYWSWITLADVVGATAHVLNREDLAGAFNLVAPLPVTNAEFTRTLAGVLNRPAFLHLPRFGVQAVFGEMGREALLASTRVRPERLLRTGFKFKNPELGGALKSLLQR